MNTSLSANALAPVLARLQKANERLQALYPGDDGRRQPVHTVYGGAQLFRADIAQRLGTLALRTLEQYAPEARIFGVAIGWNGQSHSVETLYERVVEKLNREAVEDFRIDFEDGYGNRPDAEEDGHAIHAACELAKGMRENTLPSAVGIRVKPLTLDLAARSARTLDLFLAALVEQSGGILPENFVVTLPKATDPAQIEAFVEILQVLETKLGFAAGTLKFEMMIETPQAFVGPTGAFVLPLLLRASQGRCIGARFGPYDFTAACNITAARQDLLHPQCDVARALLQIAFSGTGVRLSDGPTNIMPVGDRVVVHRAWRLHFDHVRHSLDNGFYQGWDLHPAQLPTRYAAIYSFFLESLPAASERLRTFIGRAAQASRVGDVFDDAATGQGLLNYFLRGIGCGAIPEEEILSLSGLTLEELRSGSFAKIIQGRQAGLAMEEHG